MECIVLAGGLGTRLQAAIGNYPKCMAPVNGRPFLEHLLKYLQQQGCTKIILSLGYRHNVVTSWLATLELPCSVDWVIEHEPLGTGGGIKLALEKAASKNVVVLNGDTFFDADLKELLSFHKERNAATTLALKYMERFERYGVVNIAEDNRILSFEEKKQTDAGLINGGIYIIDKKAFLAQNLPTVFSFEKDYLEKFVGEGRFYGFRNDGYFIDIGIPEDYARAQQTLYF